MRSNNYNNSCGFTLIELTIALLVFLIGVLGLLQLMITSVSINQRSLDTTIVTSLAQGKADELLSKSFGSLSTGGIVPFEPTKDPLLPPNPPPQTCYVDYFDNDGTQLIPSDACGTSAPPSGAYFVRCWTVSNETSNLKKIIVTVTAQNSYFQFSRPSAAIIVYKSKIG